MQLGSAKPGFIVLLCGILGVFVAAIEQLAYTNSWMLHIYFEASEIPGMQILTIVLFLLIGGVLAAISS